VSDDWPGGGALGGVATGLRACAGWAMVVACDMPLVDPAIFTKLSQEARNRAELDAVIPVIGGEAQPFHGLWHTRCLPSLKERLTQNQLGVQAALGSLNVAWLDESALGIEASDLAFYNVNTQQEWEELLTILEKRNREERKGW
jgi:molybdopterin-guanine dinucleotide biosynthesis protein A